MPATAIVTNPDPLRVEEFSEWQSVFIDGASFTDDDRVWLGDFVSGKDNRVEFVELKDGISVRAKSWVGSVRFSTFEVRIVPKLPGILPNLIRMLQHAASFADLGILRSLKTTDIAGLSMFELVALMLVDECERLVRNGLLHDYRTTEDDLPFLRGRILLNQQYLKRFGGMERLECRFDEHTTDIVDNQLLLLALLIAGRRIESVELSRKVSRMVHLFSASCSIDDFDPFTARNSLSYNRLNDHYRNSHELAWFILEGLGINDIFHGKTNCYAFLFDMNPLFERLLGKWLDKLFTPTSLTLLEQYRNREVIWNSDTNRPFSSIRPDFVLRDSNTRDVTLAIDAKYKRYDINGIDPSDVYQAFVYAFGLVSHKRGKVPPSAFLVYPVEGGHLKDGPVLQVRAMGGEVGAEITNLGVSIPVILDVLDGKLETDAAGQRILSSALRSLG